MDNQNLSASELEHFNLGQDYLTRGEWVKAREEFEKVIKLNPFNIWGHIELCKIHRNEKRYNLAEKELKDVLNMALDNNQAEQAHMYLGEVYRIQGKYSFAIEEFKQALKINPNNQRINRLLERANQVYGFRKEIAPYRVFFTWGMHYQCNFRCPYCNAPKPENPNFKQKDQNITYPKVQELISAWDNIYKKYGTCKIRLDGGEPSVYPGFVELISAVSRQHLLQINTNLSFDVEGFVNLVNPDKVRIDASFHCEYMSLEEFLRKIILLKEKGFRLVVSVVAYPPYLDRINDYKQAIENLKIPFFIHPFSGEFEGRSYPRSYEMCEVSKIYSLDEASRLIMGWRSGEKNITRGKLCRMGQIYGRIYPSGDVYRCCAEGGLFKIGNILDHKFQLLDDVIECSSDNCPCWKCMIVGEEGRWINLWIDEGE